MGLTNQLKVGGSNDPILGLVWLTELRNILLSDYQFTMTGYNLETVRQKRCIGQDMGKWVGPATLRAMQAVLVSEGEDRVQRVHWTAVFCPSPRSIYGPIPEVRKAC